VAIGSLVCAVAAPVASAAPGQVLPATARPHGWSLTDMTKALASFTASGNTEPLPVTPFQVLYVKPGDGSFDFDGVGFVATGASSFDVRPGTTFFVPMQNADDSPPVVGAFPATEQGAVFYFFDQSQAGGRGFTIDVDGTTTAIGPSYLSGPVTVAPLPDGGGTHMITLGAFLSPLPPGTHHITIEGGLFGDEFQATYGVGYLRFHFEYTVTVGQVQ
jgi:hypothetical protein